MSDIEYKMGGGLESIDHNDFSFRVKKKFDKVDRDKQKELETKKYNWLGYDKARSFRSHVKSRDLRRWYPWKRKEK